MTDPVLVERVRKFVLYALCGGSGVLLDFAVYTACLSGGVQYQIANALGYAAGTLLSFVLNRAFTFKVMDAAAQRLLMFLAVAATGLCTSWLILTLLVQHFQFSPISAKAVTLVVVLALQFTLNSAVTFRTRGSAGRSA